MEVAGTARRANWIAVPPPSSIANSGWLYFGIQQPPDDCVVLAAALDKEVEHAIQMAVQHGGRERPMRIAASVFPQHRPRHRQQRMNMVAVRTDCIGKTIPRAGHGVYGNRVELPIG